MHTLKNNLSVTVGITTCYGDDSILDTVKSIRNSKGLEKFRFIIVADRVPIKPQLKKSLKKFGVELFENKVEGSQPKKQKQILKLCQTDLLILTQDDVLFESKTLIQVVKEFQKNPKVTMVSILNQPIKATNYFESLLNIGTNIANGFAKNWNNGNNYLSSIGRFMAFKTEAIKKFNIPSTVATTDAYYFFENNRKKGIFKYLPNVGVIFKNPQNMTEHLRKSSRFQYSRFEMEHYFGNLKKEYQIPKLAIVKTLIQEFFKNPIKFLLYIGVNLYTKIYKLDSKKVLNAVWEVDLSTKKVASVH